MTMGCSSTCWTFELFRTSTEWIAQTKLGIDELLHLLDYFFFVSSTGQWCQLNLVLFHLSPLRPSKSLVYKINWLIGDFLSRLTTSSVWNQSPWTLLQQTIVDVIPGLEAPSTFKRTHYQCWFRFIQALCAVFITCLLYFDSINQ